MWSLCTGPTTYSLCDLGKVTSLTVPWFLILKLGIMIVPSFWDVTRIRHDNPCTALQSAWHRVGTQQILATISVSIWTHSYLVISQYALVSWHSWVLKEWRGVRPWRTGMGEVPWVSASWNQAGTVTPSLSQIRTTSFRSILSFPLPLLLSLPVP